MRRSIRIAAAAAVLLAACGGGDDGAATSVTQPDAGDTATTAAPTTTRAPVASGAGSSDDFCRFIAAYADDVDVSPLSLSAAELEAMFRDSLDAMEEARRLAPDEIEADVALFADVYAGFIELLDELDYNFMAFSEEMLEDPRLTALDDPALETAGERIEDYCGIEGVIAPGPGEAPGGGDTGGGDAGSGSGGGLPMSQLPDDFPDELVPPDGQLTASLIVAGMTNVTFDVTGDADDVIAYYIDVLGQPMVQGEIPKGAVWTTLYEGTSLNVVVTEIEPGTLQVAVTYG